MASLGWMLLSLGLSYCLRIVKMGLLGGLVAMMMMRSCAVKSTMNFNNKNFKFKI